MGGYANALLNQAGSQVKGDSQIKVVTITLTSAQLLNMKVTPVQLLPAPGIGKAYCVFTTLSHYRFKTTPYTLAGGGTLEIQPSGPGAFGIFFVSNNVGFLDQGADVIISGYGNLQGYDVAPYDNMPLTITENAAAAMSVGDGTVTIVMYYAIVDLSIR
jgi:hypothetical protein